MFHVYFHVVALEIGLLDMARAFVEAIGCQRILTSVQAMQDSPRKLQSWFNVLLEIEQAHFLAQRPSVTL